MSSGPVAKCDTLSRKAPGPGRPRDREDGGEVVERAGVDLAGLRHEDAGVVEGRECGGAEAPLRVIRDALDVIDLPSPQG